MAIDGKLNIIAEKINDSVPSTHELFEQGKIDEIIMLAKEQAEQGAKYVDVNIGSREPKLMEYLVKNIQSQVSTPLAIDTPSVEIAEIGLKAYDPAKANGERPLLNSISLQRLEMFDLVKIQPFRVLLMSNERMVDGKPLISKVAADVLEAASQIHAIAKKHGMENDDMIFDPSVAPIATDHHGLTKMTVDGISLVGHDPRFKGCHMSVGLSNFTVMLPTKTKSGALVKTPLENAFLTLTVPNGLDYCVGNTKKKYEFLSEDHPAMQALNKILTLEGMKIISCVRSFYNS